MDEDFTLQILNILESYHHRPPVSSLTTMRSTPSAIALFKVEASTNYRRINTK